jgi:DNA-binding SARP family transcriptional activator
VDFVVPLPQTGAHQPITVCLFDGLVVADGETERQVPGLGARLLGYLALRRRRVDRRTVARSLWPELSEARSSARLRTSLWRLRADGFGVLTANGGGVGLSPAVAVDVEVACSWAGRLIDGSASEQDLSWWSRDRGSVEVLPGWDDEWVIVDRERVRHRMLHGLEALSRRLIEAGRAAEAVEPALVAVGFDPLRESAQRSLISAHLAEGNVMDASRVFETYRRLLQREIGLRPGPAISAMVPHTVRSPSVGKRALA